jgi:dephospho-CoA kinase
MLIVGLTGLIGSGKSKVATIFADLGIPVIDCDVIAHELTLPNSPLIDLLVGKFGDIVLQPDRSLNRDYLRQQVFNDSDKRVILEQMLHPLIYQRVLEQLRLVTEVPYCLIVVPLLFRAPLYLALTHYNVVVDCDYPILLQRLLERSNLNQQEVDAILAQQVSRQEQLERADFVIENNGDREMLKIKVEDIHRQFLSGCLDVK